jgi:hypothetical protein
MDKKSLVILLVASSFATSAFATNIIKLITKHNLATPSIVKTHNTTKQTNHPYTDFSGTWVINCGDGPLGSIVIENNASYISVDGEESRIGPGLEGRSESNEIYTSSEHISFEWNANGSALIMKSVGFVKDNMDNSAIDTLLDTVTLTMKNGQINFDGKFASFEDVTPIEPPTSGHCVLSKKQ